MQKFYKKQQKEVEMERIDKTIEILKELLYEDRESLSPQGLDEQLDKAITHLRVFKEVDMKELMFSYFDARNNILNKQKDIKKDLLTFLNEYLSQSFSLEHLDDCANELKSKYESKE